MNYTPLQSAQFYLQTPELQEYLKARPVVCVHCNRIIEGAKHELREDGRFGFTSIIEATYKRPLGPVHHECEKRFKYVLKAKRDLGPYVESPWPEGRN